ncbi:hypothetical protein JCM33374_g1691 [Metschnikowia sp. JCM 33374]|nr:hypothetical protein JCM33374_g1691 [Metschnikowia sp. JCM 33374]
MSHPNPVLDQELVAQLTSGTPLSASQKDAFLASAKNPILSKQLSDTFCSSVPLFLQALAGTCEDLHSNLQDSQTPHYVAQIVAQIVPMVSSATTKPVVEICEQKLQNSVNPSAFYLTLYSSFCAKSQRGNAAMIPSLLSFLGLEQPWLRELSVFVLLSLIKTYPATEKSVSDHLSGLLEKEAPGLSAKSFSVLCKSLETFFPVLPDSMTAIYVSEPCKEAFLYQGLLLNPEKHTTDFSTAEILLQVLSSSCIRETARKFNTEHYLPLLIAGSNLDTSPRITALSLLCIVKLWNFSAIEKQISMDSVFSKTLSLFVSADATSLECKALLEALAYLSLGTATKSALRSNEQALEQLVMLLETSSDPSAIYGCLSVVLNLCRLKPADQDKDMNTLNYLKSVSAEKNGKNGPADNEEAIITFNHALVSDHKLVGTLAALKNAKTNSASLIVQILHSLSIKQPITMQREIVAQGGLNVTIKYLVDHSKISTTGGSSTTEPSSDDETAVEIRLQCLRTLATMCRSVNPAVAFSKYDVKTCVPFLVELLGPETSLGPSASLLSSPLLGPADKLCSLLALTNLSSLPDVDLHTSIINRAFEQHLKNLMIDSTLFAVQKAAWELINNLIASPLMLAKFFNPDSASSRTNLDLLVKMLHSQNESLQVVIAGLIANATMEFDLVSVSILTQRPIFDNLRKITASVFTNQAQNEDLVLRVATFLRSLTAVARESQPVALESFKSDTALKSGIKVVVISTKNSDIISLLRETIQSAEMKF